MPRSPQQYLEDMAAAAAEVETIAAGISLDAYLQDRNLRALVERHFITLGEALYQFAKYHPEIAMRVPQYRMIIDFRHVLVHGYHQIRHRTVWAIISADLPLLRSAIRDLLNELPASE